MGKASFVLGAGAGYVLGARAGKERYAQIKRGAAALWANPKVQSTVDDLEGKAATTAKSGGAQLSGKVAAAAKSAVASAQQKVGEHRSGGEDQVGPVLATGDPWTPAGSNGQPL